MHLPKPEVVCKVFEDNQNCIAVADPKKLSTRAKNIAINYHHFQSFAQNNIIWIGYIDTKEQTSGIYTKPLDEALLIYPRRK